MGIVSTLSPWLIGLILIGLLLAWQRHNLAKVYLNVIIQAGMLFSGFGLVVAGLIALNAGEIILPVTSLVAAGLIGVAGIYGKRAKAFSGTVSPLNLPALVTFGLGLVVIVVGIRVGLGPFLQAQENSVLAAAAGLADGARGAAVNTLLLLLTPLFAAALTVITNFATRDADGGEDEPAAS